MKYGFAAFCRLSLSKPFPSSDTESSKPLSCKVKDIVTKVRAYRTALEIKLLHTCEINALSRDSCKTDMSFCKINSFPFFVQMIFALSYKEDKGNNLFPGLVRLFAVGFNGGNDKLVDIGRLPLRMPFCCQQADLRISPRPKA